jgi:hypothetical protein
MRRLFLLVLLVVAIAAGWWLRDHWRAGGRPSAPSVGADSVWEPISVAGAERARRAIEARELHAPNGEPINVTASFGVASFPSTAGVETLVAAADEALYRAKREGKNRVATATEPTRR